MSGREAPRGRPPYRDVAPAAGPRDWRCAGCLPYRVQRSPCQHSESDCFVACFVRAVPVFFAMVFPDEHNAPDDRTLSCTELGSVSCGYSLAPLRMIYQTRRHVSLRRKRGSTRLVLARCCPRGPGVLPPRAARRGSPSRALGVLNSRWREIRACNDNVCGESKSQNSHENLLDLTISIFADGATFPIY
jgi:hypothetical protein